MGLEPRKATSLTQLPLAGMENKITFFPMSEASSVSSLFRIYWSESCCLEDPWICFFSAFLNEELHWAEADSASGGAFSGESITACLGKCCDLMPQILSLEDEEFGFCP